MCFLVFISTRLRNVTCSIETEEGRNEILPTTNRVGERFRVAISAFKFRSKGETVFERSAAPSPESNGVTENP
jgi:hypothetical protein